MTFKELKNKVGQQVHRHCYGKCHGKIRFHTYILEDEKKGSWPFTTSTQVIYLRCNFCGHMSKIM